MRWWMLFGMVLFVAGSALNPVPMAAQSGRQPYEQASLDVIYQVDGETITAWYSMSFTRSSGAVTWLLPVPANAEIVVEDTPWVLPLIIADFTEPIIEPPYNQDECKLSLGRASGDGYLPSPEYHLAPTTSFERIDASTLEAEQSLSTADLAVVHAYAAQGFQFVRLNLASANPAYDYDQTHDGWGGIPVNRSPLVRVTYTSDNLVVPIQLHAPSLSTHLDNYDRPDLMPITVHILANQPYLPTNYQRVSVDLNTINSGYNLLRTIHNFELQYPIIFFNTLDPQYHSRFLATQAALSAPNYVVEAITQPNFYELSGPDGVAEASLIAETFNERYSTLTRLRTYIHEGQTLPDMLLTPAPTEPMFITDFTTLADSTYFFGCTSETLIDEALLAHLPVGRTHLADWHVDVAHPEGWILSQVDSTTRIFAAQPVTLEIVNALEEGDPTPPAMLILQQVMVPIADNGDSVEPTGWLYRASDSTTPEPQHAEITRYDLAAVIQPSPRHEEYLAPAIRAIVMATPIDWAQNEALYQDLLTYINSYATYTDPTLPHSVIIGDIAWGLLVVGYPDGWITRYEEVDGLKTRWIRPIGADANAPQVRVFDVSYRRNAPITKLDQAFGIDVETATTPLAFEANGRRGWVLALPSGQYIVEVSAPTEDFAEYAEVLETIINHIVVTYRG